MCEDVTVISLNYLNWYIHAFFISNTFISNARLKLAKNEANAKQLSEAELLLFVSKRNKHSKKRVCIHEIIRLIIMKIKMKMKTRSHSYDINRPRSRNEDKYSKYNKCLGMMLLICIKQHLSNKKKALLIKKMRVLIRVCWHFGITV